MKFPDHLFQGTRKDNMDDAVKKGRQAKGLMLPQARLSAEDVIEIRRLHKYSIGYRKLSKQFSVSPTAIKKVLARETWRHI